MEHIISHCLFQAFPETEIWIEQIEADFVRPAFFVQRITGEFGGEVGNRYLDRGSFAIHYFSDKSRQELNTDILAVTEELKAVLRTISYKGETIHGHGINYRTEDGVLQFFVDYRRLLSVPEQEKTKMKEMDYEIETEE